MAKFNAENEHVEVEIEKLYKFSPELVYEAWTKKDLLKQWFMTSARANKEIEADVKMTIGMPGLSGTQDVIEVEFLKRETGGTQMLFYYRSLVEKERQFTNLEYRQKKKEYHDAMAHGFELTFDKMYYIIEASAQQ